MPLGYCKVCDKLVPLKVGPQKPGSRERYWYPYPHEKPEVGTPCPGEKKGI